MANAVSKALALIEKLAADSSAKSIRELSRELNIGRSSVQRTLKILHDEGWLDGAGDQLSFGTKALVAGAGIMGSFDARRVMSRALEDLRDRTGESVLVGILSGLEVVYIDKLDSPHAVRFAESVGTHRSLHSTAAGKALLSALPNSRREELVEAIDLTQHTEHTLVSKESLLREIAATIERGYAISREERTQGVSGVAVSIKLDGGPVAALVVAGPAERLNDRMQEIGEQCIAVKDSLYRTSQAIDARRRIGSP